MKRFEIDKRRNVVIVGHGGSGKTSLSEAILFDTKMTDRLGRVEEGNTVMDYDSDEIKRGNSISSACGHSVYKDYKINIIDTPGFADFIGDVICASKVADITLTVICGVNGIEVGTEKTWGFSKDKSKA
ncbi:MAG TPA: elongation factor G, partial [Firmicutes bacterium]|nr:elongation factor G [Bacillota bacterium]